MNFLANPIVNSIGLAPCGPGFEFQLLLTCYRSLPSTYTYWPWFCKCEKERGVLTSWVCSVISWEPFNGMPGSNQSSWDSLGPNVSVGSHRVGRLKRLSSSSNYNKHLIQRAENTAWVGWAKICSRELSRVVRGCGGPREQSLLKELAGPPRGLAATQDFLPPPSLWTGLWYKRRRTGHTFLPSVWLVEKQKLCWAFERMVQGPLVGNCAKEKWGDRQWDEETCHCLCKAAEST